MKKLQAKLRTYDNLILQLKYKNFIPENVPVYLPTGKSLFLNSVIFMFNFCLIVWKTCLSGYDWGK